MDALLVLRWYALLLAVAALALPVAAWLAPDWPDRGAALAPAVGSALLTLPAFWVGHLAWGPAVAFAAVLVLAAAAAVAVRFGPGAAPRRAVAPFAAFTGAFLVVLLVRALHPAITPYAGEQFLDFGLLEALRRTPTLPPTDIWFAGRPLRYYYGGPVLGTLLGWLTGTPPRYAYNLLGPTVFGSLAAAAYGLGRAIAAATDRPPRLAGWLAVLLVAFSGTLATPLRGLASLLPRDVAAQYGHVLFGAIRMDYGAAVEAARFLATGHFDYWLGRYVVPNAADVFPFWTFVNGDLRPHMYDVQFLLLGVAIAFEYARTKENRIGRRRALLLGPLPAVAGVTGLVNTWDLPAVVGVAWLAVALAPADPATLLPGAVRRAVPALGGPLGVELRRAGIAAAVAAAVGALAVAWAAPFLLFHTAANRGIALLGPTSNLGGLLLVYGGFLAAFALALWPPALAGVDRRGRLAIAGGLLALLAATTLARIPALGLFLPAIVGGWWLVRSGRAPSFAVVLLVAGAGLALVPELAYARIWPYDPGAPRWNTIYKLTMQVWALWGVGAAVALADVFERTRGALPALDGAAAGRFAVRATAVLLVVLAATYPAFALVATVGPAAVGEENATLALDATAHLQAERPDVLAAARWLRANADGQPTTVSKPTGERMYTWSGGANPLSVLTGVPTAAGWGHAAGYHGRDAYDERVRRVETIYAGEWPAARANLTALSVRYVVVGPAERRAYGVRDFAALSPAIDVAYRNERVTIYGVDRTALSAGE